MNLNPRVVDSIIYPFRNNVNGIESYILYNRDTLLQKGDLCKRNFIVDITKDVIEIPAFARSHIGNILNDEPHIQKIIIPLYINGHSIRTLKTFDAIIKYFFKDAYYSDRLIEVQDAKVNKWYGNSGIIYDSNFNPLILCTIRVVKRLNEWFIDRYICHVNPIVFENTNDPVCKGIIKKIIPVYANTSIPIFENTLHKDFTTSKPKVIIDDFSSFFISPVAPKKTIPEKINDTLNNILNDNIEEVINEI